MIEKHKLMQYSMFEIDFKMLDIVYFDHTQDGFAERGWLALGFAEHRCVIRRVHAHEVTTCTFQKL